MKLIKLALGFSLSMLLMVSANRAAASPPVYVDHKQMEDSAYIQVHQNTTYVPIRSVTEALRPDAQVAWENGMAVVRSGDLTITAKPGNPYIEANGRALYVPYGVRLEDGRTLVPVRVLGAALGANVDWSAGTGSVQVSRGTGAITPAEAFYDDDTLFWLSRIISSESQGESLSGKIAVGNVVLNRVDSAEFPNTIYGVIFDDRWGGQFEPVRNGTVYHEPTEESVLAAKLVLEGAQVTKDSLYFLAPALTDNHWIMENRSFRMIIGAHWFYA